MNVKHILYGVLLLSTGLLFGHLLSGTNNGKETEQSPFHVKAACKAAGEQIIYQCAMHPSFSAESPGNCGLCGMPLREVSDNPFRDPSLVPMTEEAIALLSVRTERVGSLSSGKYDNRTFTGTIQADPGRIFHQVCHLPGRIEKLYVSRVGQRVRRGQPIASVYSKELIAALESFHLNRRSESLARSALNNLRAWKVPADFYESADMQGDYHLPAPVLSDYSGIVVETYARTGDYAVNTHMGSPTILFKVADLSAVWAILDVFESDLPLLSTGVEVPLRTPAYPGKTFTGRVTYIGDQVDPVTRTLELRVEVSNPSASLKPGMMVEASWEQTPATALTIPRTAILWTGQQSLVYVRDPNFDQPVFALRTVTLGQPAGDRISVTEGLRVGEEVVINGAFQIDANAQLEGRYSMLHPPDGSPDSEVVAR